MQSYKDSGIIIKRTNYSEKDRILTIFTQKHGKVRTIAKGVRSIKSRRAPHLEIFNQSSLFFIKGKNFDIITEASIINNWSNLKKNLEKIAFSYQVCELIDQLTREGETQEEVYQLLVGWFQSLDQLAGEKKKLAEKLERFGINLLKTLGFLDKNEAYNSLNVNAFVESIIEKKLKTDKLLKILIEKGIIK